MLTISSSFSEWWIDNKKQHSRSLFIFSVGYSQHLQDQIEFYYFLFKVNFPLLLALHGLLLKLEYYSKSSKEEKLCNWKKINI